MSLYDNYTYGRFTYVPVGTIVKLKNLADKQYIDTDACIIGEARMTKTSQGNNVMAYPTNIKEGNERICVQRHCFDIKQYPLVEEMWLNQKIADLTRPLWMFPDQVKYNL